MTLILMSDVKGIDFEIFSHAISRGEQNITMTFKVRDQGHRSFAFNS